MYDIPAQPTDNDKRTKELRTYCMDKAIALEQGIQSKTGSYDVKRVLATANMIESYIKGKR